MRVSASLLALGAVAVACAGCPGRESEAPGPTSDGGDETTASSEGGEGAGSTTAAAGSTGPTDESTSTADASASADDSGSSPGTLGTGEAPAEFCPEGVTPSLQVGYGPGDFVPVSSGPALLIAGHQGGFHVELGLVSSGFDVADWGNVHFTARVDGQVVADHDAVAVLNCQYDLDPVVAHSYYVNMIFDAGPDLLLGATVEVDVELTDRGGQVATDSVQFVIGDELG